VKNVARRVSPASAELPLPPDDKGKISVPVRRRVENREREGRLPNWCVNINEGTGPSAAILNHFVTELDHCIVRDCEMSRGRKNAADTQAH